MPSALKAILSAALVMAVAPTAFAAPAAASATLRGEALFTRKGCIGCHTLKGHDGAEGTMGPDLSKIGKERERDVLVPWILDPQAHRPGGKMPTLDLTRKEAEALADYLLSERPRKPKRR